MDVSDNLRARSIYTQVMVLKKVAVAIIGIFALASMLMVFDSVRQFGASILASAGIAGIVVGFAAQRSIATLLAGFHIALTQPIRVDDVVVVENEFGRIEDITLTYVIVRVWDLRRLVVPITYFIEKPFQNWTRSSSDIVGTVFFYVDYTVPVDALRAELTRLLQTSKYWDGKVNTLQVTDAKEHTLEIRVLASAANAALAWNLRCEIREKMVAFIQQKYPESLPRLRATLDNRPPDSPPRTSTSRLTPWNHVLVTRKPAPSLCATIRPEPVTCWRLMMMMKIFGLGTMLVLAAGLVSAQSHPSHQVTNGDITATIYLPDAKNGFYTTTRFDWSGAVGSLKYKGHEYYGIWWSKITDIYDFGYEGPGKDVISADFTAMVGPAEEFGALGYDAVPAGGLFVKPGIGVLKRDEMNYNHSRPYAIANGGKWDVKTSRDAVEFTHTLSEPSINFGYVYRKSSG